jgi:hypothetical protein
VLKILSIAALIVAIIGVLAGGFMVSEVRHFLGLRDLTQPSRPSTAAIADSRQELPIRDPGVTPLPSLVTHPKPGPIAQSASDDLQSEYDTLTSRIAAVAASLQQRARDLGDAPIKPEITAGLGDCRLDIAAAKKAIDRRENAVARSRMDHIKSALKYLESL